MKRLETSSSYAKQNIYAPFGKIWFYALDIFLGIIEKEIEVQKGSAFLNILLKNEVISVSEKFQHLVFEINNTGQEYARDVSVQIQSDSSVVLFQTQTSMTVKILETGINNELSFEVIAKTPVNTTIRGTVTFSDRIRENKQIPFSFPLTVIETKAEFLEIPNPYVAGNPIKGDSDLFMGREDAYEFIDKNILASGEHHTISFYGLRRTGKSSLLNRIMIKGFSDKRLIPVYLDMQGISDEKDFYNSLFGKIADAAQLPFIQIDGFSRFKQNFKQIKTQLADHIIVVLMDEFEALQELVEQNKISGIIFNNIRHLMQHEDKLIFLFCGAHKLEEMSSDYWSIFFNTALYLKINYLKKEETEKLIQEPVKEYLTFDQLAIEQIYKMTHGQPYLTQLICRTLVNQLNESRKRNVATINEVDEAVDKIVSDGNDHFSTYIWKQASTLDRLILSATAEELTQKQLDKIGIESIFDRIELITKKFSKKEFMDALGRLNDKDIIRETNGRCHFPVNLFREWLNVRQPLLKVRSEIS